MNLDIALDRDGDLYVTETGDIGLTDNVRQAVRVRLLWFLGEWKFAPDFGVPYYEEILTKRPSYDSMRGIIRSEVISVEKVKDVKNITFNFDKPNRKMIIALDIIVDDRVYREEVIINAIV